MEMGFIHRQGKDSGESSGMVVTLISQFIYFFTSFRMRMEIGESKERVMCLAFLSTTWNSLISRNKDPHTIPWSVSGV